MTTQGPYGAPPPPAGGGGGPTWGAPPAGPPSSWGQDAPGPPPPPWQRRRRRTGIVLGVLAVLLLLGGGTFALLATGDDDPGPLATDDDRDDGGEDRAPDDGKADGSEEDRDPDRDDGSRPGQRADDPTPVDPTGLSGTDAEYADLLNDIDASERAMIAFQDGLAEVFLSQPEGDDVEALFDELRAVAADAQEDLGRLRGDLQASRDDEGATEVRDRYVTHLDAWVRYLEAVEQDPSVLAGGPEDERYLVAIDTTGDAFARALRERLPAGTDPDVQALAEGIIERGFPERELADEDTV